MAKQKTTEQSRSEHTGIVLGVATPHTLDPEGAHLFPWPLICVLASLGAAICGWVIPSAFTAISWLDLPSGSFASSIKTGISIWLLSHGAGVQLESMTISLAPLGLSALMFFIVAGFANFAARQTRKRAPEEMSQRQRLTLAFKVSATMTGSYFLWILIAAAICNNLVHSIRLLIGLILIGFVGAMAGASFAVGIKLKVWLPLWIRKIIKGIFCAHLVMCCTGALVLLVAIVSGKSRIIGLYNVLDISNVAGVLLICLQLIWMPNLIIWGASWASGAGFAVGVDTIVSPTRNSIGALPGVPIFGAVPTSQANPNIWLVMLPVIVAGMFAGGVVVANLAKIDLLSGCLAGGISGSLAGFIFSLLALISAGGLGVARLAKIGPIFPDCLIMCTVLMGIGGVVSGVIFGLIKLVNKS